MKGALLFLLFTVGLMAGLASLVRWLEPLPVCVEGSAIVRTADWQYVCVSVTP